MNSIALRHVLWKEARQVFPIALTIGVLFVLLLIGKMTGVLKFQGTGFLQSQNWIWYSASLLCALGGLTLGVTSFANERENGTDQFLSNLPIPATSLGVGKLLPGLAVTALFSSAVLLVLSFFFMTQDTFLIELSHRILISKFCWLFALVVLPAMELFAWGGLFSILTNRTLLATLLGTLFASLAVHSVLDYSMAERTSAVSSIYLPYGDAWHFRSAIVIGVLIVDYYLSRRWALRLTGHSVSTVSFTRSFARSRTRRAIRNPFFRLVWQTVRQSAWPIATACVTTLAAVTMMIVIHWNSREVESSAFNLGIIAFTFMLMGMCVFWSDQRRNAYLFFQQHAEYGRNVWFARMFVWSVPFLAAFVLFEISSLVNWGYFYLGNSNQAFEQFFSVDFITQPHNIIPMFIVCLGCFGIGQLFSMFSRSSIMAPFFAALTTIGFCTWSYILFEMYIGFWWSVLPIPIVLLLATFLHARQWISSERRLRSIVKLTTMIGIVFAVTIVGVCLYRANEIPEISSPLVLSPESIKKIKQSSKDFEKFREEDPELYEKYIRTPQNWMLTNSELEQANENRETVVNSITSVKSYTDLFPDDLTTFDVGKIRTMPDRMLSEYLVANQQPLDALMGIQNRLIMTPLFPAPRNSGLNIDLRTLLLSRAELSLRNGELINCIDALTCLVELYSSLEYGVIDTSFAEVNRLWERWMDHPDQSAEILMLSRHFKYAFGNRGGTARFAYFDIAARTDKELSRVTGHRAVVPIRSEKIRTRRLNSALLIDQLWKGGGRRSSSGMSSIFGRGLWGVNKMYFEELKWKRSSPGISISYFKPARVNHSKSVLNTKFGLRVLKLQNGEYPTMVSEDLYGMWNVKFEYKAAGMDGDVYCYDEGKVRLVIEKDKPYLLNVLSNRAQYERWNGVPRPDDELWYEIELTNGETIKSSIQPNRHYAFWERGGPISDEPSRPMYRYVPYPFPYNGQNEQKYVPVDDVVRITSSREIGEGETTYLLNLLYEHFELHRLN